MITRSKRGDWAGTTWHVGRDDVACGLIDMAVELGDVPIGLEGVPVGLEGVPIGPESANLPGQIVPR